MPACPCHPKRFIVCSLNSIGLKFDVRISYGAYRFWSLLIQDGMVHTSRVLGSRISLVNCSMCNIFTMSLSLCVVMFVVFSSDYRLNQELKKECKLDIPKFCKEIIGSQPNDEEFEGKVIHCLKKQYDQKVCCVIIFIYHNSIYICNSDP